MAMTRGQAWDLLTKYNKEPFHLRHAITVEHVMGWYAQELGYGMEKDFWSLVGLLHDLDSVADGQRAAHMGGVGGDLIHHLGQRLLDGEGLAQLAYLPLGGGGH